MLYCCAVVTAGCLLLLPGVAWAAPAVEAATLQNHEQRLRDMERELQQLRAEHTNVAQRVEAANQRVVEIRHYVDQMFTPSTESRTRPVIGEDDQLRSRLEQVLTEFVDFGGYFRAGYGRDDRGGVQPAFRAPGAPAKYRLGNETEEYGEIILGHNWYKPGAFSLKPGDNNRPFSGPVARAQLRLAMQHPYNAGGTDFSLAEAWAMLGNVLPNAEDTKFWAGQRFYRRHDININDFYFLDMSGSGGGVEDMVTPVGKLAVAWLGNSSGTASYGDIIHPSPVNKEGFSKSSWDVRLYDVDLPLGHGEFALVYANSEGGKDISGQPVGGASGFAGTFIHTAEKFTDDNSVNKFSVGYGRGAAKTFTSSFETFTGHDGKTYISPDESGSWRVRVTEHFIVQPSDCFSIGPAVVYQYTDYGSLQGQRQWVSAGLRPIYHATRNVSVALEPGMDYVRDTEQQTGDYLLKITLAPQVSLDRYFMSRPVLRLFVTYAQWGSDFRGKVGGPDYAEATHGWSGGVQMELWW
jgi:maltoporin